MFYVHYTMGYLARISAPFAVYYFHLYFMSKLDTYTTSTLTWYGPKIYGIDMSLLVAPTIALVASVIFALRKTFNVYVMTVLAIAAAAAFHVLTGFGLVFGPLFVIGGLTICLVGYAVYLLFILPEPTLVKLLFVIVGVITVLAYIHASFYVALWGIIFTLNGFITSPACFILTVFMVMFVTPLIVCLGLFFSDGL